VAKAKWHFASGAAKNIKKQFPLTMSDHLFDNVIVDLLMESAVPASQSHGRPKDQFYLRSRMMR